MSINLYYDIDIIRYNKIEKNISTHRSCLGEHIDS